MPMEKKNIDWGNLGFGYVRTDKRYVSNYKDGSWDQGGLTEDADIVLNECAGVLQYAQTIFEGLKAYTTDDGRIVAFRPDLNAQRMEESAKRLEMPVFPPGTLYRRRDPSGGGECGVCSAIRQRRHPLHPSLYVRQQSRYRCKTGGGVPVQGVLHSCGAVFQGRRETSDHTCQ